jgi:ferredoxin
MSIHESLEVHAEDLRTDEPGVRVKVHPGLCEGWGNCHRFAPNIYPLDEDGKIDLRLLEVPAELAYEATLGAGACPEEAITVIGPPFHHWAERRWRERGFDEPDAIERDPAEPDAVER